VLHHFVALPVVSEWYQFPPRTDLKLRPRFASPLESSVEGYPLISTLVPAPGSESMRKFAPSISVLPLMDRRPITLGRSLLGRVERKRAVEFARGTEVSWYDREELRLIIDEEARPCELSK
jgi:hypothetical protein